MPSANDVQKMMARLDGYELKGHQLRINMAKPKENDTRGSSVSPGSGCRMQQSPVNNNTMQ